MEDRTSPCKYVATALSESFRLDKKSTCTHASIQASTCFLKLVTFQRASGRVGFPIDTELGARIVERVEDKLRIGLWIQSAVDEPVRAKRARGQHSQALRGIKQGEVMSEKSGKSCQQHAGLLS
jgi:hypothetical protein